MTVPPRSQVDQAWKWNAESVFPDAAAWNAEQQAIADAIPSLASFQGQLAQGPHRLVEYFSAAEQLARRAQNLFFYARMNLACETTDQTAAGMTGQAGGLLARLGGATAFAEPELLKIGQTQLMNWVKEEPGLTIFEHYLENLFRQQAHVRSGEVEELLALAGEPFGQVDQTEESLTSADMKFRPATTAAGAPVVVAQGSIDTILGEADRDARRTAWESYADGYLAMKNTLASNYLASVKRDVFYMRARRYDSTLDAALFQDNIPKAVFHSLLDTYRKHIPTWHRYWAIRRKALGVETLHPYDIWAPLAKVQPVVPYTQAVEWIAEGMLPLGKEYVNILRNGCLEDRWVDVYPNQGKTAGAFSYGTYDTHPFILMSYDDNLGALSTLAHELGHSMHSYYTRQHQPFVYGDYTLFAAEVASNFNQAMVRSHLFKANPDANFQIAVIEEAMNNIHRYFFIMPTLARFELEVHERIENGKPITADDMINLMTDLFSEGYGSEMHVDRERVGITWAQFGHLYANYYVFQYATGISAAHALCGRILDGVPGAVDNYLSFLSAGSSMYPVDALKMAGVDMSTPEAVERTFGVLASYVDRLEKLTSQ
jgi:oligoendopeptidase F